MIVRISSRVVAMAVITMMMGWYVPRGMSDTQASGCCTQCGHRGSCRQICRLVCEQAEVEIVCWGRKSEDFCVPGPSHLECRHCESVCADTKADDDVHTGCKPWIWTEWAANCHAKVFTRQKLVKKTITRKVPSYKWVVQDICASCEEAEAMVPNNGHR